LALRVSVSKRALSLADAALVSLPPTSDYRSQCGIDTKPRSASLTSSNPTRRPQRDCRSKAVGGCWVFCAVRASGTHPLPYWSV
jgi:hypothetical protein